MRITVVKIGGSVLFGDGSLLARKNALRIIKALRSYEKPYVIIHGLGSLGRQFNNYYFDRAFLGSAISALSIMTRLLTGHLQLITLFHNNGIPAYSLPPTSVYRLNKNELILDFARKKIHECIIANMVPITYGGTLWDEGTSNFTIISSDEIVKTLSLAIRAERVIWMTDVDGVFLDASLTGKPIKYIRSDFRGLPDNAHDSSDITGGMQKKVSAALDLARKGIPSAIINGFNNRTISNALFGKDFVGTIIK